VGMEATATGNGLSGCWPSRGTKLWIGHASQIRAGVVRKQKTDARDAAHLLRLLVEKRFRGSGFRPGRAGRAATVATPTQAGLFSGFGEEPAARAGHEPRHLPEEETVHGEGA